MDDRRIPWLVSACVLALLPVALVWYDWPRVIVAIVFEVVIMFYFAFLAGRNNRPNA